MLNIITALPCEARPLIDYYHLKKIDGSHPFTLYHQDKQNIYLIISGIGKVNSACATTYLHHFSGNKNSHCYLNLGMAGSKDLTLGNAYLINKIIDTSNQKKSFPSPIKRIALPSQTIQTFEQPQMAYPDEGLVDMESSGFFHAANLCVAQSQIQLLKIVSDNQQNHIDQVNKNQVIQLIEKNIEPISHLIEHLRKRSAEEETLHSPSPYYHALLEKWHFSTYQQHQLQEILRRWAAILPDMDPITHCEASNHSKTVLSQLDRALQQATYDWTPSS